MQYTHTNPRDDAIRGYLVGLMFAFQLQECKHKTYKVTAYHIAVGVGMRVSSGSAADRGGLVSEDVVERQDHYAAELFERVDVEVFNLAEDGVVVVTAFNI